MTNESLREFFRNRMEEAQRHQQVSLREVTQFYLVNLLSDFVHAERLFASTDGAPKNEAFALLLGRAIEAPSQTEQFQLYKQIGDRSLYLSGFFGDSLRRKIVDIDYYIAIGERAYGSVSELSKNYEKRRNALSEVFDELTEKFPRLVDLLSEISEKAQLTSDEDLLRIYERWLATRSEYLSEKLKEHGIVPIEITKEPIH